MAQCVILSMPTNEEPAASDDLRVSARRRPSSQASRKACSPSTGGAGRDELRKRRSPSADWRRWPPSEPGRRSSLAEPLPTKSNQLEAGSCWPRYVARSARRSRVTIAVIIPPYARQPERRWGVGFHCPIDEERIAPTAPVRLSGLTPPLKTVPKTLRFIGGPISHRVS